MENWIEFTVVGVYLIFMVVVGGVMKRFNANSDDYFRSGARSTWWLMGPSLTLSMTSAAVFTAVAGGIFESGLAPISANFAQIMTGIILATVLAAWFRQMRAVTAPEIIRERFGPATQQVFAYLNMLMQPVYGALQLMGLGIFVSAVFGLPLEMVVLALGVVVGAYSVSGGKWAVMATDFLQSLTLYPVIILVSILCIIKAGGPAEFWVRVTESDALQFIHPEGEFSDGRYTLKWVFAVFFMQTVAQLQMGWAARFFTAKDGNEAKKAAWFMLGIGVVTLPFLIIPPLAARLFYVDEVMAFEGILTKPAEAAFVVTCQQMLPAGMMGLVIVAMFSATASSMDTGINGNAGNIVRNVVPPFRRILKRAGLTSEQELVLGRRVSTLLALIIICLAFYFASSDDRGLFEIMLNFAARVQFPIAFPLLLALFIWGAPRVCVLYSMGVGLLLPWLLQPVIENWIGRDMDFADRVLMVGLCSLGGFLLSYLFKRFEAASETEKTKEFYRKMLRPVQFKDEVGDDNDIDQLETIGKLTFVIAGGLFFLLVVPNDFSGRLLIVLMAGAVAGVGGVLLGTARVLRKKLLTESPEDGGKAS